jgi:DhnA family fructose-bisphosphate aldolase class Ia
LCRLFSAISGKTIVVPVDDSLIFGPVAGLGHIHTKLRDILRDPPEAVLAFLGLFRTQVEQMSRIGWIVNLTASTSRSQHTRKVLVGTVEQAAQLGVDAVAVHVNITSKYEPEMIRTLGSVAEACEARGMPLLAIMYPRSESNSGDDNYDELKQKDRKQYAELVAHSARVAVDLGADIIKTQYTGDSDSFRTVVEACKPIPIIVAGGPLVETRTMLENAYGAISAGGAGISFGRNVFSRQNSQPFVTALKAIVHEGLTPDQASKRMDVYKMK